MNHLSSEQLAASTELISSAQKIVITTHKSPDGDAIGSSLGLFHVLLGLGKQVNVIVPDEIPSYLLWLKGTSSIVVFEKERQRGWELIQEADLIFSLDYNSLGRVGEELETHLRKAAAPFILIDHHQQPEQYAKVIYSDTSACSTAEMVYCFTTELGWKKYISIDAAEAIYCGIMTDSGSFRFPAVTAETHIIAADLMTMGLDHSKVHREVYDTNLLDRLRLVGYALNEKLEVLPECGTAFIALSKEELYRFNHRSGDTEGLVNQALSISGVKLAAFFREGTNEVKISFRSKGSFDVNQFARNGWNGGGHRNAAGGRSTLSLNDTIARFKSEVEKISKQITES
jgi:bifunctional oligoribonuclease and PAP phosphatase NrnA